MAAMSVEGYVGVRVVEGSVDGDEFFDFIAEEVVCVVQSVVMFAVAEYFY